VFKKIDIPNFGLFVDYNWKEHIGNDSLTDVFKNINIIYGRNYSGKTTFSRIFRYIETGNIHERYSTCKFLLTDKNNKTVSEKDIPLQNKIRVFNSDFVKFNLSWLYDNEKGEIKPFTLLGSGNIEASERIEEIEKELGNIEKQTGLYTERKTQFSSYAETEKTLEKLKVNLEQRLQKLANQVIKTNNYYWLQGKNYNIANITEEISVIKLDTEKFLLDENTKSIHKATIDEKEKLSINSIHFNKPNIKLYFSEIKPLVEKKITLSKTLNELISDSLLQKWVDEGRSHHRNKLKKCAFCNGDLTPERWEKLDAHFSKESDELKKAIERKMLLIDDSKKNILTLFESNNILKENYYSILHNEFDEINKKWISIINDYSEIMANLNKILQERYDDIFNPKTIEEIPDISEKMEEIITLLNLLSEKNNKKSSTIIEDKNNSRSSLRFSEISRFLSEINYFEEIETIKKLEEKLLSQKIKLEEITSKIKTLEEEKKQEEINKKDEGEAAKKITNHLYKYFGHDSLWLDPEQIDEDIPKTKFIVKRGNEPAFHLSEGECSLISFCYFIAKMEDELESTDSQELVIYIDDPVSSLDNNHIFFMFSLIETIITKDKKYKQLFISTHNLDFLKYIKRLTIPRDEDNRELINHFIVEKRKRKNEYRCFLSKIPSYLRDYITEYNFLFNEIYKIARPFTKGDRKICLENNFNTFYNLPNNMRRFLECYLFYRYPNTDEPLKYLNKLFNDNIPVQVSRVVNEYSHLTQGDRGTIIMDVPEAEYVARKIIEAIIIKDIHHYEALCESIKVDKDIGIEIPVPENIDTTIKSESPSEGDAIISEKEDMPKKRNTIYKSHDPIQQTLF